MGGTAQTLPRRDVSKERLGCAVWEPLAMVVLLKGKFPGLFFGHKSNCIEQLVSMMIKKKKRKKCLML